MSSWDTVVRIINLGISLFCIVALLRKAHLYWGGYQSRTRDFWWVLMCWSLVVFLGTIEVFLNWGTSFRVLFTLGALVLMTKVVLRPNEINTPTITKEF